MIDTEYGGAHAVATVAVHNGVFFCMGRNWLLIHRSTWLGASGRVISLFQRGLRYYQLYYGCQ